MNRKLWLLLSPLCGLLVTELGLRALDVRPPTRPVRSGSLLMDGA